jgi:hypothetical protein
MSESLYTLKIFVKDSPKTDNKYNKLIFEFLNNNIEEIISYGCYIRIVLLNNLNIDKFLKMKINNIPALYDEVENKSVTGVENIIKYIIYKCNPPSDDNDPTNEIENISATHKKTNRNNSSKSDNDDNLRNYLMKEVLSEDIIEDPIDLNKVKDFEDTYKKTKERLISTNSNVNKNLINNVKKNINEKSYNTSIEKKSNNLDNMMSENNEITKTQKISNYMNDDPDLKKFWENLETTSDT